MITIDHKTYTDKEIEQVFRLAQELIKINDDQNAKLIAMNAKLENEEKKVKGLQMQLFLLSKNINMNN